MEIQDLVGSNIRHLRKDMGLSQEAFAFECDLHRNYISDLERGKRNPTVAVLKKIADALGVTPDVLLRDTVDKVL